MDYRSNITLADAARLLGEARHIIITTHTKPDGDAFGSVAALKAALLQWRPRTKVDAWLMGPILPGFKCLRGMEVVKEFNESVEVGEPDLIVVVDTGAWAQVSPMRSIIESRLDRTLILDHHLSGDLPARHMYIDSKAAACAGVIADVLDEIEGIATGGAVCAIDGEPNRLLCDPTVSESLFAGISSDTGWFKFSNTNAATHVLAARLIRAGIDHANLYARLEQSERPEKLALQIRALQSLKLLANNTAAIMSLRAEDFTQTGALAEETERFVDMPQAVESVKMVVMISQPPWHEGKEPRPAVRLSFRSKPGPDAVNVADFAAQFGGGGHARAAGAKIDDDLNAIVKRVEEAVLAAMM
ncbi:MAG: DHH family phosphoesterase [Phycisphaeraceae bacterium]